MKIKLILCIFLVSTLLGCKMEPPDWAVKKKQANAKSIKIGFSISTLNNPFFVALKDGAVTQAKKEGVILKVTDAQNDTIRQNNDIDDLVQQQIDVLLINPVDSRAISSAVLEANRAGIPVITIDRRTDKGNVVTFISSDNVAGGKMAAQYIFEQVGANAKVAELEGILGASATRERGLGFHSLADNKLNVVIKQSADFDRAKGLTVTENILQAHNDIKAIFAQNDEMALGAAEAIKSIGKNIIIVGFDGSNDAIKAVKEKRITATIAQQPYLMGQTAIMSAEKIILKQEVKPLITVPLRIIN